MNCEHHTLNATVDLFACLKARQEAYRCRCAECGARGPSAATVAEAVESFHAYYPVFEEVARRGSPAISAAAKASARASGTASATGGFPEPGARI